MAAKRLKNHERVEAVIYADVYGEEAAMERYKLSARSLRNYRRLVRKEGSELSETFRTYVSVIGSRSRAEAFSLRLRMQAESVSALLMTKAREANPNNPEVLRVLNEHFGSIMERDTAIEYMNRLFGGPDGARDRED